MTPTLDKVLFDGDARRLGALRRLLGFAESLCAAPMIVRDGVPECRRGRSRLVSTNARTVEISGDPSVYLAMPGPSLLQERSEASNPALRMFRQASEISLYRSLLKLGHPSAQVPQLLRDVIAAAAANHPHVPVGAPYTVSLPRFSVPASIGIHLEERADEPACTLELRFPRDGEVARMISSLPNSLQVTHVPHDGMQDHVQFDPPVAHFSLPASPTEQVQSIRRGGALAAECRFEVEIAF